MEKICGVYKITNKIDGKFYIGSSNDIFHRWYEHKYDLKHQKHSNKYLQKSWNKYGENNFEFEIIEECKPEIQFEREQYYLNILNPYNENGYNLVRKISDKLFSQNYIKTICNYCGNEFYSFSHLAKICDDCKNKRATDSWNNSKFKAEEKEWFEEMINDAYGNYDNFWESVI